MAKERSSATLRSKHTFTVVREETIHIPPTCFVVLSREEWGETYDYIEVRESADFEVVFDENMAQCRKTQYDKFVILHPGEFVIVWRWSGRYELDGAGKGEYGGFRVENIDGKSVETLVDRGIYFE